MRLYTRDLTYNLYDSLPPGKDVRMDGSVSNGVEEGSRGRVTMETVSSRFETSVDRAPEFLECSPPGHQPSFLSAGALNPVVLFAHFGMCRCDAINSVRCPIPRTGPLRRATVVQRSTASQILLSPSCPSRHTKLNLC